MSDRTSRRTGLRCSDLFALCPARSSCSIAGHADRRACIRRPPSDERPRKRPGRRGNEVSERRTEESKRRPSRRRRGHPGPYTRRSRAPPELDPGPPSHPQLATCQQPPNYEPPQSCWQAVHLLGESISRERLSRERMSPERMSPERVSLEQMSPGSMSSRSCPADVLLAAGSVNEKVQDIESSGSDRHNGSCFGARNALSAAKATQAGDAGPDSRWGQARNPASLRNLRVALSLCVMIPLDPGSRRTGESTSEQRRSGDRKRLRRPAGR